uniref:Uncharacterized protein n=1 Tax=Alexandrium catenella TaxID=2925 RepID=A0A7S1S8W8_ALECA|eukprot:CAMPEP_0171216002 /NCGR_PEP_ID=MMETSP0790-20130122/31958_1 /TAXON_ID=2925 /ORGANISM="Alexandrium catenella, Strain OF101" /LENGTH=234 /DNA_ID=CAMNT_0011681773 /DNA_START=23 /DNA_END=730 /DNA_ORIENTATION=-
MAPDGPLGMWPALQPTPKLSSLLSAGSPKTEALREELDDACECSPLPTEGTMDAWRHRGGPGAVPSTERVEEALAAAFDRLWLDRPGCGEASAQARGVDTSLDSTVDTYISHYFRHVAELSRESVYQAHQRAILCRMREDMVAGDRSGNMRELEARIEKVDVNDRSLQAEIASLMRIVEPDHHDQAGCKSSPCCSSGGLCCRPVIPSAAAMPEPPLASGETGKVVDGCQACTVQ